jgi:hypothetical protein
MTVRVPFQIGLCPVFDTNSSKNAQIVDNQLFAHFCSLILGVPAKTKRCPLRRNNVK